MNYKEHRKQLLKNPEVREEYDKLLPEYELAKSVIEARLKRKMTQVDVAKKAGMPQSTISRIEGLTHGLPKLSSLRKIADALDARLIIKLQPKVGRRRLKRGTTGT
jgi:transcriptional regulator with XRE-family HTH domain